MDTLLQALGTLALALLFLAAAFVAIVTQRLLRLRWQTLSSQPLAQGEMPASARSLLDAGAKPLMELGFRYCCSGGATNPIADLPNPQLQYYDVYAHPDGHTHAMVTVPSTPNPQQPSQLQLITCLTNGNNWTTLNCTRHLAPFDFPRWPVFDDYLPRWSDAWLRHLQRVQFAQGRICTDSAEVARRIGLSFEKLVPALAQQGKLLPTGVPARWRLSLATALDMAVGLLRGQLRSAWAQRGQTKTLPSPSANPSNSATPQDRVEADLQSYTDQRALLRANPASARTKWLVFGVTALLFLLVGGWWMSWSFVPIVLAVVALHEGGHYLAMRLTGYRNVSVFFLPGLGGLAVGEKVDATPLQKLFVFLAGPMPGIVLATLAYGLSVAGSWSAPGWLNEFLIATLVINYLNLLPLLPLDGGQIMETFVFARHPRLRFAFAGACCAVLLAAGIWLEDTVLRVVAVLLALGLPAQWRRMQLDPRVPRDEAAGLDEPAALRQIFTALQDPRFQKWSFAQRSAAATAMLPELLGRRARGAEVWVGLLVYGLCLLGPLGFALYSTPQLAQALTVVASAPRIIPDDVTPEPPPTGASAPVDWLSQVAQVGSRDPDAQLAVYLGAARQAHDSEDRDTALRHYLSAWTLAQSLPPRDLRRIDALEGLAELAEDTAPRRAYLDQIVKELDQPVGAERIRVAQAKEQLSLDESAAQQQIALLREALLLRKVGLGAEEALSQTRLSLAHALDAAGDTAEAEELLRARVLELGLPSAQDRSRAALQLRVQRVMAQVDLIWFLLAHQRWSEAQRAADYAGHLLPATATTSWIHPQIQVREAALWTLLLAQQKDGLGARWEAYEAARNAGWSHPRKILVHEVDRALVAQALANPTLYNQAIDAIRELHTQHPGASAALCQARTRGPADWRWRQSTLRVHLLGEITRCQLPAPAAGVTR